jgi:hypothetical protein
MSALSILTILAAILIIAVLGWEQHAELQDLKRAAKESGWVQHWDYDGGWPRGLAMMLAGGIIVAQIYSIIKVSKKEKH